MTRLIKKEGEGGFLKYIAYLQVIGIVLVVLGHSFHEYPDGNGGMSSLLYRTLHSFRMPVFMFVSGFLMIYTTFNRGTPPSWRTFAAGKVKRLMMPFIVLTLVTFVPRSLLSMYADDSVPMTFSSLINALFYRDSLVIPYFWFLHSSFTLLLGTYFIFMFFGEKGKYDKALFLLLDLFFLITCILRPDISGFFSLGHTLRFGLYFVLGASYCRFRKTVDCLVTWENGWFLAATAIAWAVMFYLFENTSMMALCSIAGIMMCVSLSKIMVHRGVSFLDHLIGANYIIFLLSWYFNVLFQQVLHHYVALPWPVHTLMSLVAGIYVPWLFYKYMQRHPDNFATKFSKIFLGQSFKRYSKGKQIK